MDYSSLSAYFNVDSLSWVMLGLLGYIWLIVGSFSTRYLRGDRLYVPFFFWGFLLVASLGLMVAADHLLLFYLAWGISNAIFVRLMIHKPSWKESLASGKLAAWNFLIGYLFLGLAFLQFYWKTGEVSIQLLVQGEPSDLGLVFLCLTAMTQCALWPFHRWLLSSLNSPTPVSALMHAGLVNGGGFLLTRFAPLLLASPYLLQILFILGVISTLVGTLWKLMQHDRKRMLACSTMGQMGFMIAQCGLGLFPAAVAHLCFHGLFKSYLFLGSGAAAQEKRWDLDYPPSFQVYALSFLSGLIGVGAYLFVSEKELVVLDTSIVLLGMILMVSMQLAIPLLRKTPIRRLPLALVATSIVCAFYGLMVEQFEVIFSSMGILQPQSMDLFHGIALLFFFMSWGVMFYLKYPGEIPSSWGKKRITFYVKMLNASQPKPETITAHRNQYRYL